MNVAIISARGGSKRIPRKNIKDFLGKPIIAYSIETAIASKKFDTVMVSTDDDEIAAIAKKYGADIPFLRSAKNSDDYASTADVIEEVLINYKNLNKNFKYACCIYPTAPLVKPENIIKSYNVMIENNYNSVYPVCAFSYPIQRSLTIVNNKITMLYPDNINKRSQDLQPTFHDAGQFYWIKTDFFLSEKKILTTNTGAIILSELEVQDIDNESDWKLAELKYKITHEKI